jgi:hypothetical protein
MFPFDNSDFHRLPVLPATQYLQFPTPGAILNDYRNFIDVSIGQTLRQDDFVAECEDEDGDYEVATPLTLYAPERLAKIHPRIVSSFAPLFPMEERRDIQIFVFASDGEDQHRMVEVKLQPNQYTHGLSVAFLAYLNGVACRFAFPDSGERSPDDMYGGHLNVTDYNYEITITSSNIEPKIVVEFNYEF